MVLVLILLRLVRLILMNLAVVHICDPILLRLVGRIVVLNVLFLVHAQSLRIILNFICLINFINNTDKIL